METLHAHARPAGALLVVIALALAAASAASAKMRITLTLADSTPTVGQAVRVAVRADLAGEEDMHPQGFRLRLIAVPPGVNVYTALDDERRYGVKLTRSGTTWRGTVRLRRPGQWQLVVPNWGAPGYAVPPPLIRAVIVRRA